MRHLVRETMENESLNLVSMAQIAKNSSTRAYAGHAHEMRSIFEIKTLNLTEFARSFALYKNLQTKGLPVYGKKEEKKKSFLSKRDKKDGVAKDGVVSFDDEKHFKKRLLKSQ